MPDPATHEDLQQRLKTFNQGRTASKGDGRGGVAALAIIVALASAAAAYALASWNSDFRSDSLRTSTVEPFQAEGRPATGRLEFPEDEVEQVEEALISLDAGVIEPEPAAPDPELMAEVARLRSELEAARGDREAEVSGALDELRAAFAEQSAALQAAIDARDAELEEAMRKHDEEVAALRRQSAAERDSLRAILEARRDQDAVTPARFAPASVGDGHDAELAAQLAEAERQRQLEEAAAAAERDEARIMSPAVVYSAAGGRTKADAVPSGGYRRTGNEAWLERGAAPLIVQEAERLTDPDRTLAQGTVIQAALQTAINSDLPGNVVAVVSEPVPAFSGNDILIPRGSRLFGQYRSGAEVNQKRILILWTRVLTPDGTSMQIASAGGDQLGRSGMPGLVDTKFDERFGGAALISLIGAAPALAARQSDDLVIAGTLEDMGDDLEDATDSVIAQQFNISPTIRVDQGATVTVLVDRDVVIY